MYHLLTITLLGLLASSTAMTDDLAQCIKNNSEPLSNEFLIGSWYEMYLFTPFGERPPVKKCAETRFTKPSAEVIAEYKKMYNDSNFPFSLDDNQVMLNDAYWFGMVTGSMKAKFFVLDPKKAAEMNDTRSYSVMVFRPLSDNYFMWLNCAFKDTIILLYAKDRYAPVAEMKELIKNTPELSRLDAQRYCDTSELNLKVDTDFKVE